MQIWMDLFTQQEDRLNCLQLFSESIPLLYQVKELQQNVVMDKIKIASHYWCTSVSCKLAMNQTEVFSFVRN